MAPLAFVRRMVIGLLGALASGGLLVAAAHANEFPGAGAASGLVVHDAQETLSRFCRTDPDGRLWLELPGGARFELVTSTGDPAIANAGDGSFHAFESDEVRAALAEVRFPLERVAAEIFLLPFPRRSGLESAAARGLILLSPGVRPIAREHQHAELIHELGHVVQYALMPDADAAAWNAYRRLRGIEDATVFAASAAHADRPHEIFAEDFRMLFGDPLATYSGSIENARLAVPATVEGLDTFMLGLVDAAPPAGALAGTPNPARGAVLFSRPSATASELDLFDVAGRRIATLEPSVAGGMVRWSWDGRAADGRFLAPGVVFARARASGERARVTLLP